MNEIHKIVSYNQIYTFLKEIDDSFLPSLSQRVDLKEYAGKLCANGKFLLNIVEGKIVSAIIYYLTEDRKQAYIPIVGTIKEYQGKGLGSKLLRVFDSEMLGMKVEEVKMETWLNNHALFLYLKMGYCVEKIVDDREGGDRSVKLFKKYKFFESLAFNESIVQKLERLSDELASNLWIFRDELFPIIGGGTKGRKLKFILSRVIGHNANAVVSAGSCQSNHLRATAVMCSELGIKFTACIHDDEPDVYTGNLKILSLYADKLVFCKQSEIKEVMNDEMMKFLVNGYFPYYIFGGGHEVEGSFSLYKAVEELAKVNKKLDYIFVASGTGGTQAGLIVGAESFLNGCNVIGISVARDVNRGIEIISKEVDRLCDYYNLPKEHVSNIIFDDSYLFGGYGQYTEEYLIDIKKDMKNYGLLLDPTYSGKAFFAMKDYLLKNNIPKGSNILFWNTGGIFNVLK